MRIGPYQLDNQVILAPMAGVTDQPFRQLCYSKGAGLTVSEMLSSNPKVWKTGKSRQRMDHSGELGIRAVQIAGSEPSLMAEAAKVNVDMGAQIIDINMGCPAKKVNKKMAGSALMQYPELVEEILTAVVSAVDVPVTLKTRTGWNRDNKNGIEIAKIAERCGIQSLAVHGRTRACMYKGEAEYDTIRAVKEAVSIPVIANGDIKNSRDAIECLKVTNADGVMIGRASMGAPWLVGQIDEEIKNQKTFKQPDAKMKISLSLEHLKLLVSTKDDVVVPYPVIFVDVPVVVVKPTVLSDPS